MKIKKTIFINSLIYVKIINNINYIRLLLIILDYTLKIINFL